MHPFRLPGRGHPLFSFILSCDWELRNNTGSAKVLTPSQLSDTAFVQRTALTNLRLLRATIWSRATLSLPLGANRRSDARARTTAAYGRTAANASLPQRCSSRVCCRNNSRGRPAEGFRAESSQQRCPTSAPAGGPLGDETRIEGATMVGLHHH